MEPGKKIRRTARGQDLERRCAALEAELAEARGNLRTLLEAAPLGVHRYRLSPEGRLVFLGGNRAADGILGIDHAALRGKTIEEAFPSLVDTPIPDGYRRVIESGESYQDELVTYRDNRIETVFDIAAFATDPSEMAVFFRDITAQKKAEEALVAKAEELDRYFSSSLDLLCIADTDAYFRRLNPQWEKTLGWRIEDLVGRRFMDFVHPEDVPATIAAVASLSSQTEVLNFVNRYRCKDGTYRWIEWRSFPQGKVIYAVARDVTERRRIEAALREGEERLAGIFRAAPVGVGRAVRRVMAEVNQRCCEITGYPREALIGRSTRMFYPDEEAFLRAGERLAAQEFSLGVGSVETVWLRGDGSRIDVLLNTSPIATGDPDAGVAFTILDISQRKRDEKEREVMEARMRQTQKLESLGVLAGGIAHDFNNILMAILGHADLAQAQLPPDSPARESMLEVEQAARRAADLVRQMLAYAGKGRFRVGPLDLNEVIREMAPMLEVSISKKAELRVRLAPSLPSVEADVAQLRQVVMNLVINASEAIGDAGGTITLATGRTVMDRSPATGGWVDGDPREGDFVYLDVEDCGAGMDEATRARIFDPFFTTKFTGRGLGLAAVIGIVRGHGGAIRVQSAPGKGAIFTVALPADTRPARSLDKPLAETPAWRGEGTVLLVDDEESVRKVGVRMLQRLGLRVFAASDGREAVELFRVRHGEIRCVIMDLSMPRMGGEESFIAMRRIDPSVRILMSSGYEEPESIQRFTGQGLAGFIQKPYQLATLTEALRRVFQGDR